ncbi:MAG: adenosylmethionine decarboxylase [Candidatus Wildermuthbacteria bacterium]|nr:adenosylmethionine decarboxylase [Candidatus Wildermuthbacteria bacterium]
MRKKFYAGTHIIADFWFARQVKSEKELKGVLLKAAQKARSTPLKVSTHAFHPQGITGVVLLAESHIALHSWPELEYIAADIFTCGTNMKPKLALEFLKKNLKPKKVIMEEIKRGVISKGIKLK